MFKLKCDYWLNYFVVKLTSKNVIISLSKVGKYYILPLKLKMSKLKKKLWFYKKILHFYSSL